MGVDIVCGKEVDEDSVNATVGEVPGGAPEVASGGGTKRFYGGTWYYFCSLHCRLLFTATPDEYIEKAAGKEA